MVLSRVDETDLVVPLHNGVHERPPWDVFLARLRRRVRADGTALLLRRDDAAKGDALQPHVSGTAPPALLHRITAAALRPSRVYGEEAIAATQPLRIVRIDDAAARCTAWLVVWRAQEPFGAAEGAVLSGLVPHAAIALRTWATLARARDHATAADAALARLDAGWIATTAEGRIADCDAVAAARLRDVFATPPAIGDRLPLAGGGAGAMAALIAAFANPAAAPRVVTLSDAPPLAMLAMPAPAGMAAALLGCLRSDRPHPHRAAALAQAFGLPPSEARLAAALAEGRTLAEAAVALGLTIETARNYSKRIYAKTGARGQADLVRRVLASVAAFA